MPRAYRSIILAAVGWLILTGQHSNRAAKLEQSQTERRIADAVTNIASTNYDMAERTKRPAVIDPCGPNQYNSNADLCAQWKAADAATNAAWWAAISAILSVVGLLGVAGAIFLTIQSNRIARDTARRQLRAYLNVILTTPLDFKVGEMFGATINLANKGQTPAYDVVIKLYLGQRPLPLDQSTLLHGPIHDIESKATLASGEPMHSAIKFDDPITQQQFDRFHAGQIGYFAYGVATYKDIFDEAHSTYFRFLFVDGKFSTCEDGNHSN